MNTNQYNEITLNLYKRVVTLKDGRSFNAYYTKLNVDEDSISINVKFTRECKGIEKLSKSYKQKIKALVYIPYRLIPLKNEGKIDYPNLWVKEIYETQEIEDNKPKLNIVFED